MAHPLMLDSVWLDKPKYDDAEKQYLLYLNRDNLAQAKATSQSSLVDKITQARLQIKNSLQSGDALAKTAGPQDDAWQRQIVREHTEMRKVLEEVLKGMRNMEARLLELERVCVTGPCSKAPKEAAPKPKATNHVAPKKEEDEDDVDLFGSDEDEEADKAREERLKAYHDKKSKKPQVVAKSSIVLDVKPWDDETNMKTMETEVRKISMDGLVWGASKLVPLAYGIQKLQIVCVVEDDKVSIDELQEKIEAIEDLVQSIDIAAFNKI